MNRRTASNFLFELAYILRATSPGILVEDNTDHSIGKGCANLYIICSASYYSASIITSHLSSTFSVPTCLSSIRSLPDWRTAYVPHVSVSLRAQNISSHTCNTQINLILLTANGPPWAELAP